jgi:hypothetical protein
LSVLTLVGCGSATDVPDTDAASVDLPGQSASASETSGTETSDAETLGTETSGTETSDIETSDTTNYDSQLQLIADNAAVWMGDTELIAEPFFYAVTDLDQNGRLEIIQSSCQGTGLYTYTSLWEVDANGTELVPCQLSVAEGESQPDIIADPDMVYFDEAGDCYYYIFHDDIRDGAAEHYLSRVALSLQDGVVTTTLLCQMHSVYTSSEDVTTTYTDADGNAIDEDAYNMAAENTFAGLTEMEATIGWTDYTVSAQLDTLTEAELMEILETSWESFSLN